MKIIQTHILDIREEAICIERNLGLKNNYKSGLYLRGHKEPSIIDGVQYAVLETGQLVKSEDIIQLTNGTITNIETGDIILKISTRFGARVKDQLSEYPSMPFIGSDIVKLYCDCLINNLCEWSVKISFEEMIGKYFTDYSESVTFNLNGNEITKDQLQNTLRQLYGTCYANKIISVQNISVDYNGNIIAAVTKYLADILRPIHEFIFEVISQSPWNIYMFSQFRDSIGIFIFEQGQDYRIVEWMKTNRPGECDA